jgi:hypothetical protein
MTTRFWEIGRKIDDLQKAVGTFESEYKAIHDQRIALIRSYNMWFAFGSLVAFSSYWILLSFSLTVASLPLMFAGGAIASCMIWFAYRTVRNIDRAVVALYPRIVFLELILEYDFYRDYLRRRPRGDTERSFIERCEQANAETTAELWHEIYSNFNDQDFPGDRRLTNHFSRAAFLSIAVFWIIIVLIVAPQYFTPGA